MTASEEFAAIQGAPLTLLGLIIAFSFSMAVSRYDLRESYEEAGANAIHTEYVRADLLPAADALTVRALLKRYLDQRVLFYETRDAFALADGVAGPACLATVNRRATSAAVVLRHMRRHTIGAATRREARRVIVLVGPNRIPILETWRLRNCKHSREPGG